MTTTLDQDACRDPSGSRSLETDELGAVQRHNGTSVGERRVHRSAQQLLLNALPALVVTLTIVGGAGFGLFLVGGMEGEISVKAFEDVILSWGHWGILASIGLMVVHSFVPFPAELVALANGMLYGPFWGTVITWVGAMLGAFLAFGLSRALGRPFVKTVVARRHWQRLDDWTGEHAAQIAFLARFVPVIAFNLVNYAAGLTRISWWTFGWTTGLGILPMTILMAAMGSQAGRIPWQWWLLLVAAAGLGWFAIQRFLNRRTAKRATQTEDPRHCGEECSGLYAGTNPDTPAPRPRK